MNSPFPKKKVQRFMTVTGIIMIALITVLAVCYRPIRADDFEEYRDPNIPDHVDEGVVIVGERAMSSIYQPYSEEEVQYYTDYEVELISKTVYGEARGAETREKAAVVWCILNRVDNDKKPDTIEGVVTQPYQFYGYKSYHPVDHEIKELVIDVLDRWVAEKNGEQDVGRVLPAEYLYFMGDGEYNHFTKEYGSKKYWDWSLPNPYES